MKTRRKWLWSLLGATALFLGWMTTASRAQNPATLNARAPELIGGPWLNTPDNKPLTLEARRGKVTIVQFWTLGCSNCQANLPAYARLKTTFEKQDVTVIGVHTPETDAERDPENVARRVKELGITYPILIDSKSENWQRWKQQYWPTIYLIDKAGRARHRWIGELEYKNAGGEATMARLVEGLLKEAAPAAGSTQATDKVTKIVKSEAEWKKILTAEQFYVLRRKGTERAFSGDYKSHEAGVYQCAACGLELFTSDTKFDSGTGWPSFWKPIAGHVAEETDADGERIEVLCARCDGHLGHVFDDGPKPTGLRYCMNSVSLKFAPKK